MRHDILSDVLSIIKNGNKMGKKEVVTPSSSMVKEVLLIFQKHGYIGEFELIDDNKGGKIRIELNGKVNSCGSIRPRYSATKDSYEKYERRFLPSATIGLLIVSTSSGVMTHNDAKKNNIGGKMLAFVY